MPEPISLLDLSQRIEKLEKAQDELSNRIERAILSAVSGTGTMIDRQKLRQELKNLLAD